jgi:hypothetical protein
MAEQAFIDIRTARLGYSGRTGHLCAMAAAFSTRSVVDSR